MPDEIITIQVNDAEIDATIGKIEGALGKKDEVKQTKKDAEEAKEAVDEVVEEDKKYDLKGKNLLVRRTISQLPAIRGGYRLMTSMKTMLHFNPYIAFILVAWMAGRTFIDWLTGEARETREYLKMIMEARGFTTQAQAKAWREEDERKAREPFRSVVPS